MSTSKMFTDLYVLKTLSNTHVGSGDINFGVIDNLIQRDVLTTHPTINSSGIKGALREFYRHYNGVPNTENSLCHIFGSDPKEQKEQKQGAYVFFDAQLLSLPVRSNKRNYLMATSPQIIKELISKIKIFGISSDKIKSLEILQELNPTEKHPLVFDENLKGCKIEEMDMISEFSQIDRTILQTVQEIFGEDLVLLHDADFNTLCTDDNLPVIARNQLEDGRSKNLWYEQILPRYTRLYFMIRKPSDSNSNEEFDKVVENNIIQVGANASIGYGYAQMKKLPQTKQS